MRKTRLFISLFIVILFGGWFSPAPAHAQSGSCPPGESTASGTVVVEERNADITILENGDVRYVETWVVNFAGSGFRFAFRSIPLNRATSIGDWGVSEGGIEYQKSSRGDYVYVLDSPGDER